MARILLIDDEAIFRRAVGKALKAAGHTVLEEEDGHIALRHFAGDPADVILTDVFMPNMDGIDFLARVQEAFPETPVIVMSGGGRGHRMETLDDARALGAFDVLAKPFPLDVLLSVVERALSGDDPDQS